ncbi:hypothetical protein ACIQWZ_19855 [Streptomyces sp. NPDC098077]|uniref:hypothetical protein n=1 Tax=Streptomyces sp. NPDC098077 TaxID=3366093 RepID=UPI00382444D1
MSDQKTPQEIGADALDRAVQWAGKAHHMAEPGPRTAEENAAIIGVYSSLAAVYADIAKAAALTANNA